MTTQRAVEFEIQIALTRRAGAPARPARARLKKAFNQALVLCARKHRGAWAKAPRLVLDVIYVDDREIARLNFAHLKHRGATDVLSFPMGEFDPEREAYNLGEVVVSFSTAKREAEARGISFENEMSRYCVHGFLHLLGYDDSTPALRDEMFAVQEKALL